MAFRELFCHGDGLFIQQGQKVAIKGPLFEHVYELFEGAFFRLNMPRQSCMASSSNVFPNHLDPKVG